MAAVVVSDRTFTPCTWRNRTHPDIASGRKAARSDLGAGVWRGWKGSDVSGRRCAFRWSRLWKELTEFWEFWWTGWSREACCTVSTWSSRRITVSSLWYARRAKTRFKQISSEQNWFRLLLRVPGMEEASCERGVFVSDYVTNLDEFSIIQGPAARIRPSRLPEHFFSCEFTCTERRIAPCGIYLWPPASCFSLFSQLRGPGEQPVGMPTIPKGNVVFLRAFRTDPAGSWLPLIPVGCVSSEVQDR